MNACCLTGHRKIPPDMANEIRRRLICTIDRLYTEDKITTYYAGGAQGFDALASEVVIECRAVLPDLRLVLVVPYVEQAARWSSDEKVRYERIKREANDVICLAKHYYRGCMQRRNRYLVDHSDVCVCYLTEPTGGTAYTVGYARKQGIPVLNLTKEDFVAWNL